MKKKNKYKLEKLLIMITIFFRDFEEKKVKILIHISEKKQKICKDDVKIGGQQVLNSKELNNIGHDFLERHGFFRNIANSYV